MAFDLAFTMGLNDEQFRARLRESQGEVDQLAGRVGRVLEARTEGVRRLTGAVSSSVGAITATIGALTVVGGLLAAGATALDSLLDRQQRIVLAAQEEADARREALQAIEGQSRAFASTGLDTGSAIPFQIEDINARAQELSDQIEAQRLAAQAARAAAGRTSVDETFAIDAEFNQRQLDVQAAAARQIEDLFASLDDRFQSVQSESNQALLRSRGDDLAASIRAEEERLRRTVKGIRDLLGDDPAAERLVDRFTRASENTIANLQVEAAERGQEEQRAAEQRSQSEREALTLAEERASVLDLTLERELAALDGDQQRVRELDRQLALEQRLAQIRQLDVSEAERARLVDRAFSIANRPERADEGRLQAVLQAGTGLSRSVIALATGAGSGAAQRDPVQAAVEKGNTESAKQTRVLESINRQLSQQAVAVLA